MLKAIQCVHADPSFITGSLEASEALEAASHLLVWCQDVTNRMAFTAFAGEIMKDLQAIDLLLESSGRTPSANRERMWRRFFSLRSSEGFIRRWISTLRTKGATSSTGNYSVTLLPLAAPRINIGMNPLDVQQLFVFYTQTLCTSSQNQKFCQLEQLDYVQMR